ncbi:MAG: hypothetical protein Q4C00_05345 [Bacillota bacterium]|nr:hypothetical protein [Bacillota bacterium]
MLKYVKIIVKNEPAGTFSRCPGIKRGLIKEAPSCLMGRYHPQAINQ